jgi:hypothetical protein
MLICFHVITGNGVKLRFWTRAVPETITSAGLNLNPTSRLVFNEEGWGLRFLGEIQHYQVVLQAEVLIRAPHCINYCKNK